MLITVGQRMTYILYVDKVHICFFQICCSLVTVYSIEINFYDNVLHVMGRFLNYDSRPVSLLTGMRESLG